MRVCARVHGACCMHACFWGSLRVCARVCVCVVHTCARCALYAHAVSGTVSWHSGAAERFFLEMLMSLDLYVGGCCHSPPL